MRRKSVACLLVHRCPLMHTLLAAVCVLVRWFAVELLHELMSGSRSTGGKFKGRERRERRKQGVRSQLDGCPTCIGTYLGI